MKPQTKQLRTLLAVPGSLTGSGFKQLWSPNILLLFMTWPHTITIQNTHLNPTYLSIDIFVRQLQFAISPLKVTIKKQKTDHDTHSNSSEEPESIWHNLCEHLIGPVEGSLDSVYWHKNMKNMPLIKKLLSRELVQKVNKTNHTSTIST